MTKTKSATIKFSPVNTEARKKLDFNSGDTVKVSYKIREEKASTKKGGQPTVKFRTQAFEGVVLARKHGTEPGSTFTVRKTTSGVGVERIFPLYSPLIEKIEITKKSRARRAKLYYIRDKAVKDVRKKLRAVAYVKEEEPTEEEVVEEVEAEEALPEETEKTEVTEEEAKEEKTAEEVAEAVEEK